MSKTAPLIPLVAVVGPTASGKSALAMELARFCNGEVVSSGFQNKFIATCR